MIEVTVQVEEISAASPANYEEASRVLEEVSEKVAEGYTQGDIRGRATFEVSRIEE